MSFNPLISIIMPVYNGEKYIRSSIESVIKQTIRNWELIVINDGSTDNTKSEILSFTDSRIRYFEQTNNGGVSLARNVGLRVMKGDFFCFLDSDDLFTPNSLESRLMIFKNGPDNLDFVDGRVEERDETLGRVLRVFIPTFEGNPFKCMLRISESCYLGQTWMLRRKPDRTYIMRMDLTHGEDFFFFLQQSRNGGLYKYTNETILIYRRHASSATNNLDGLNRAYLLIHKEIKAWNDVTVFISLFYWLKSRKIMFLSYLINGKSLAKALRSLFQWA